MGISKGQINNIYQHWFSSLLGAGQATGHYLNQSWLVYWRIYASLSLNELKANFITTIIEMSHSQHIKCWNPTSSDFFQAHFKCDILYWLCHLPNVTTTVSRRHMSRRCLYRGHLCPSIDIGDKWSNWSTPSPTDLASWWRNQMETFSALLAICAGNPPVPGEFPHKGQWHGALMLILICVWINGWVNNGEAGDLRRYHAHYDVTVMIKMARLLHHEETRVSC